MSNFGKETALSFVQLKSGRKLYLATTYSTLNAKWNDKSKSIEVTTSYPVQRIRIPKCNIECFGTNY